MAHYVHVTDMSDIWKHKQVLEVYILGKRVI